MTCGELSGMDISATASVTIETDATPAPCLGAITVTAGLWLVGGWLLLEFCTGVLAKALPYVLVGWECCTIGCFFLGLRAIRAGATACGAIAIAASLVTFVLVALTGTSVVNWPP